jgi:hypothetical protein
VVALSFFDLFNYCIHVTHDQCEDIRERSVVHQIFACYLFDPENVWCNDDCHVICVHFVVFGLLNHFVEKPCEVQNGSPI